MNKSKQVEEFNKRVKNKFDIYNSLFLNLPYGDSSMIGKLLPLLYDVGEKGLKSGKHPLHIIEDFFSNFTDIRTEKEKTDFMFRVIQYVERQVVLFDSVEDAAFDKLSELGNELTIKDFFEDLHDKEIPENVSEKLAAFSARIVFTAHPTQFYPPSVLEIISSLKTLIIKNDIDRINTKLHQLGLTSLLNSRKPTPLDEARNIIYYMRNIYYDAVGDLYSRIKEELDDSNYDNPNIIRLGFWPGGDRDGNPFVTAEITKQVADELRMALMKCYYNDLKKLEKKLSFKKIDDILDILRDKVYSGMFNPSVHISYEEIINPLLDIRKSLKEKFHSLYLNDLDLFIDKVKIFKTFFASLDIRQDHRKHKNLITSILIRQGKIKRSLDELTEDQLTEILLHEDFTLNWKDFKDQTDADTIRNFAQLREIQKINGEEGCNRYIISNSEDKYSVLFVFALFRWCGQYEGHIAFDIIPLFETLKGMNNAENSMQQLFSTPEYKAHLSQRENRQTIMLGFSDGTKDAGYMNANWSIFRTKEKLSSLCFKHNIKAIFFDGRGGPPARGGGKTHRFYAAQGNKIANHEIQLTIQGQTITSKFGTKEQFIFNSEQLLTAGLFRNLSGQKSEISQTARRLFSELAELSYQKYRSLKEHEKFIPYLENKSPLKYYAQANVGSRPAKRGQSKKLELSDLRAIPFVGSWSQLKQNVPGYFGIGTAISTLIEQRKLNELRETFNNTPLFKALILNGMMSLFKTNFELTRYMMDDDEYGDFWNLLYEEYKLSKEMLIRISGYNILLEEEPLTWESIKIREKIVLPLLLIQQYALQKISSGAKNKKSYEKIVIRSLYGNINASRNSV